MKAAGATSDTVSITATISRDQYVDLVMRSGLIDAARLSAALSDLHVDVVDSTAVRSILVDAGLLTPWQGDRLLRGKYRGFFLGRYKLLKRLGVGGMGSVYLAEHVIMRHQVAIKVLSSGVGASVVQRFHQEARAAATFNHPHLVKAFDVDQAGQVHYLVMEYIDGCDLRAWVNDKGPLSFRRAAEYIRQAAKGLAHVHAAGLIHRDVKPANLLVDRAGVVKVLDLGLVRVDEDADASLTVTMNEKHMGTVDFLAPEQARDCHQVDARADIYGLGCTLYFLLTGRAPFSTGSIAQRIMQHQDAEPKSIRQFRRDVPDALLNICQRMMAKSPSKRYPTMAAVGSALASWLSGKADAEAVQAAAQSASEPANEEAELGFADADVSAFGDTARSASEHAEPAVKEESPQEFAETERKVRIDTLPATKPSQREAKEDLPLTFLEDDAEPTSSTAHSSKPADKPANDKPKSRADVKEKSMSPHASFMALIDEALEEAKAPSLSSYLIRRDSSGDDQHYHSRTTRDRMLENRIAAVLNERRIPDVGSLSIQVLDGRAILRGPARTIFQKKQIEVGVRSVRGIVEVIDEIKIAPSGVTHSSEARVFNPRLLGAAAAAMLVIGLVIGCIPKNTRPSVFPVQGQLLLGDAAPAGARVVFYPKNADPDAPRPTGLVDKAGKFVLTTYETGDGAPQGDYLVTVSLLKATGTGEDTTNVETIAPKYRSPKTTKLTAVVAQRDSNRVLLTLGPALNSERR